MNALVLGGNGFIGSYIVEQLLSKGHRVRVYGRRGIIVAPVAGVDYRHGNFDDMKQLDDALDSIDVVFHLISATVPSTSNLDPVADIQRNLINTVNFLKLLERHKIRKLVYVSSGGTVYGVPECSPIAEAHPLNPISSYGIVKVAIENYLHMNRHINGLDYVVLRASNPYGARQSHKGGQGVIGTFLWKVARQERINIYGDGSVVRDYLHVRDLAELCILASQSSLCGCYNAGSGEGRSILELIDTIASQTKAKIMVNRLPGRSFDVPHCVLDISASKLAFDWLPKTSFENGIRETWSWIQGQHEKTESTNSNSRVESKPYAASRNSGIKSVS